MSWKPQKKNVSIVNIRKCVLVSKPILVRISARSREVFRSIMDECQPIGVQWKRKWDAATKMKLRPHRYESCGVVQITFAYVSLLTFSFSHYRNRSRPAINLKAAFLCLTHVSLSFDSIQPFHSCATKIILLFRLPLMPSRVGDTLRQLTQNLLLSAKWHVLFCFRWRHETDCEGVTVSYFVVFKS